MSDQASGTIDLAGLLPLWLEEYIQVCCLPEQLPALDAKHADLHARAVEYLKFNGLVFQAPCGPPVSPWVRQKKRNPPALASRPPMCAQLASPAHAHSELPAWQAAFMAGMRGSPPHALELLKPPPFHIQNGDAADEANITALAHLDVRPGDLFHVLHGSGWWMLLHILADGNVDKDPDRPRLAPCPQLVYDFVLHITKQWKGYGWYLGWWLVLVLRAAFQCGDLPLSEFVG